MISSLELARRCGVSQGTVDRALHGRPGISEQTRARVLAAAARLGYRPNPAVRELLGGQSTIVGGVVPSFASIFFQDLMQRLAAELLARGQRLLLGQATSEGEFRDALGEFAARRAGGAVVVPPAEGIALGTEFAGLRVVSLVSALADAQAHHLAPDAVRTGRAATEHLIGLGHRRIAHLTYARASAGILQREHGYREAMRARGLAAKVAVEPDAQHIVALARAQGITALFCHNDWLALAAIRALTAAGIGVPAQVSVLGVDASPGFTALYPGIASLRYPAAEIASACAQALHGEPHPPIPDCALVPGATLAIPA